MKFQILWKHMSALTWEVHNIWFKVAKIRASWATAYGRYKNTRIGFIIFIVRTIVYICCMPVINKKERQKIKI